MEKKTTDTFISPAEKADAAEIDALYESLKGDPFGTWTEEYPTREMVEEDLDTGKVYVMRDADGRIISAIAREESDEFDPMGDWYPDAHFCELARLGVAKDMQGHGIAMQMILYAMDDARKDGYDAVRYVVAKKNTPAQRAYVRLGYEYCGEAPAWGEAWLCYQKRL